MPFHSQALAKVLPLVKNDVKQRKITLTTRGAAAGAPSLLAPVLSAQAGQEEAAGLDFLEAPAAAAGSLFATLAELIAVQKVDWSTVTKDIMAEGLQCGGDSDSGSGGKAAPHVLGFGPGKSDSVTAMTARMCDGAGSVTVLCTAASFGTASAPQIQHVKDLAFVLGGTPSSAASSSLSAAAAAAASWLDDYAPRLVRLAAAAADAGSDAGSTLDTKFTRLTGRPPILVAGMTPTTSFNGPPLVAALANAGYAVELAGGGLPRASIFRSKVEETASLLKPGAMFSLNLLFLNAKQFNFQLPLACELRREGMPIESITVAAGVPSVGVAVGIVQQIKACGMRYVSFKPGSADAIQRVLDIAKAMPDFPVLVQWTGGRGGGHHSFEDMHQPLLATYAQLRRQPNIVLLAGSGLGDAEGSLPYLTGTWSERYGRPPMPFDATLVASRMMVAKEAATAPEVKALIVACEGVAEERKWEQTYEGEAGGILTVRSELGEPIHKVANRGMRLWREFDQRFFEAPRGPVREQIIRDNKAYIIDRINADFQKLYFGCSGGKPVDLQEMTYGEVLCRMVQLMHIDDAATGDRRWIDPTFKDRVLKFAHRTEERFAFRSFGDGAKKQKHASTTVAALDADPNGAMRALMAKPCIAGSLVTEEDADYFIHLCKFGGKPVNFIPIIDGDLETWFKKDSLWYSEDLAAVPERDADRVCCLQGPVAVRFSIRTDEGAAEILDNICAGYRSDPHAHGAAASCA